MAVVATLSFVTLRTPSSSACSVLPQLFLNFPPTVRVVQHYLMPCDPSLCSFGPALPTPLLSSAPSSLGLLVTSAPPCLPPASPTPPPSHGLVGRSLLAQFAQPTHFMSLNPFLAACLQVWGQVLIRLSLFLPLPLAALPLTSCSTALMAHRILNTPCPPSFIDLPPFFHFTFCFNHLLCRFKHLSASPLPTVLSPATLHQTVHLPSSLPPFFLFFPPIQPLPWCTICPPPHPST